MNEKYVSDPSNSIHISLQNYKPVVVSTTVISNSSVSLNWTANPNATRYYVTAILPYQSDREIQKMTNNANITCKLFTIVKNIAFIIHYFLLYCLLHLLLFHLKCICYITFIIYYIHFVKGKFDHLNKYTTFTGRLGHKIYTFSLLYRKNCVV